MIELHLSREPDVESALCCACNATGLRPIIDRAIAELADSDHPTTPAEHDDFVAGLRPALEAVNDTLDPEAAILLTATGNAPSFVPLQIFT